MDRAKGDSQEIVAIELGPAFGRLDATLIGIGTMIAAGAFVLIGLATVQAGPGTLAAILGAGLLALLTAFSYAELASACPASGGAYSYAKYLLPDAWGFAAGWAIFSGYIAICSLCALALSSYLGTLAGSGFRFLPDWGSATQTGQIALAAVALLSVSGAVVVNIRGKALTGGLSRLFTAVKFLALILFVVYGAVEVTGSFPLESFQPLLPSGLQEGLLAMGLSVVGLVGFDLVALMSDEIKEPQETVPKATFSSLLVSLAALLLIALVCIGTVRPLGLSGEPLSRYQATPIIAAAQGFMPALGVGLVAVGGLLALAWMLNAALLASSRVAFAMCRDGMLPQALGRMHAKHRTPHRIIAASGGLAIVLAFIFPMQSLGSATGILFLAAFALVNLSLLAFRRRFPEPRQGFRVPLYPVVPAAALGLNLVLAAFILAFESMTWIITIAWSALGLAAYFASSGKAAESAPFSAFKAPEQAEAEELVNRMLIPLHSPVQLDSLMRLALPIAHARKAEIVALNVVEVPISLPLNEGKRFIDDRMPLLMKAVEFGASHDVPVRPVICIAHRLHEGILAAVESERISLIFMKWKGYTTARDRIMGEVTDKVVHQAACDLVTVKLEGDRAPRQVFLPTAGGPHASLASEFVSTYQEEFGVGVTCGYVVSPSPTRRQRELALEWIEKTVHLTGLEGKAKPQVIEGSVIAPALVQAAADYDMIVIGASKAGLFSSVLFGEIPEQVARLSKGSVMIVKRYEGPARSVAGRIRGG